MKVTAYAISSTPDIIRAANPKRDWMNTAVAKNPYRCLPLSMANSWGWEVLSSAKFTATWDGGQSKNSVKVVVHEGKNAPTSHFGEGTITWHTGFLFKTDHPIGMYVTGAPNAGKPNVIPLSGIVETSWLPYSFTMNWKFTQPGSFTVDIGEPYCQIFPVNMTMFDEVTAEIKSLDDDPEFKELYWDWNVSRANYAKKRQVPGTDEANPNEWQRYYFQGKLAPGKVHAEGAKCPFHINSSGESETVHRTKPNVPEFVDLQTKPFETPADYHERTFEAIQLYNEYIQNISPGNNSIDRPVLHRTPDEINKRIKHYENFIRGQLNERRQKCNSTSTTGSTKSD